MTKTDAPGSGERPSSPASQSDDALARFFVQADESDVAPAATPPAPRGRHSSHAIPSNVAPPPSSADAMGKVKSTPALRRLAARPQKDATRLPSARGPLSAQPQGRAVTVSTMAEPLERQNRVEAHSYDALQPISETTKTPAQTRPSPSSQRARRAELVDQSNNARPISRRRSYPRPMPLGDLIGRQNDDTIPLLVQLWRQRQDLRRALQRLDLQCQATIRRSLAKGPRPEDEAEREKEKEAAAKLWGQIKAGKLSPEHPLGNYLPVILSPYLAAMKPLEEAADMLEKRCEKLVGELPIWTHWGATVKGMGKLSLAGALGEAGASFGAYRSPSALWKRFGLAVIDGERQRRKTDPEEAARHGYAPSRRAYAYVISTNLMRSQGADGPYRAIYDARKAYELGRSTEEAPITLARAHNRALRIMVKELLKQAWLADRRLFVSPPDAA